MNLRHPSRHVNIKQMEILANPEAMSAIQRARAGKTVDHPLDALDEA